MIRLSALGLLLFGTIVAGCARNVDPLTEISAVKVVLDRFYIAQQKEDMAALSALMAHDDDLVVFSLQEGKRYEGWEAVKEMYERQMMQSEGIQTSVADQVIAVSKDGTASWVSSVNHAVGRSGVETVEMDYYSSLVLEKRDGKWLIVHLHNSQSRTKEAGAD